MQTEIQTELPVESEGQAKFVEPSPIKTRMPKTKQGFIGAFVRGVLGGKSKMGNLNVENGSGVEKLVYHAYHTRYRSGQGEVKEIEGTDILALRFPSGIVLSNANRMRYCGSHMAWGSRTTPWGQTAEQRLLESEGASPVPFSVFEEAKLDIMKARIIVKAPSENVMVKVPTDKHDENNQPIMKHESRHYVGACLLEVDGNFFLFDIDREEILHGIFNPFVVKLARESNTIEDSYASLVPAKVELAKAQGLPIERQGEWFFIRRFDQLPMEGQGVPLELQAVVDNPPHAKDYGAIDIRESYEAGDPSWRGRMHFEDDDKLQAYDKACEAWSEAKGQVETYTPKSGSLRHGTSRPNTAEILVRYKDMVLVSGLIQHSGREHRDVRLEGYWEAVGNTAIGAWQVSGEID